MAATQIEPDTHDRDNRRWLELLERLRPDGLADAILPLVDTLPGYEDTPIPRAEIRRLALLSFEAILDGLRSGELEEAVSVAAELGSSRARVGVELNALISAIRLDFTVLWEALTDIADDADAPLIVRRTSRVMRVVDEYVVQAQRAYLAEAQRMSDRADSRRRGLLGELFGERPPSDARLADIAGVLGIAADGEFLIASAGPEVAPRTLAALAELSRLGVAPLEYELGGRLLVLILLDQEFLRAEERLGGAIGSLPIGIDVAHGVGDVRRAARIAEALEALVGSEGDTAMTWDRGWVRFTAGLLRSAGAPELAAVERGLAGVSRQRRERLVEAVRGYLVTGGIAETAEAQFCHRNTISKRLREFRELTGIDPLVPAEAARLVLAWPPPETP